MPRPAGPPTRPSPAAEDPRRPDVIVDFVHEDGLLSVAIENIGEHPAVDVSVAFDPPCRGLGGALDVASMPVFRGIPFLAPRRRIATLIDSSAAYFARREPTKIAVTVRYADRAGAGYEDVIRHDLDIYRGLISHVPARTPQG